MTTNLHSVTTEEADTLVLRAAALQRFLDVYRHNPESQRTMLGALRRIAVAFTDGECTEKTFPWELVIDADLSEQIWSHVAVRYSVATATKDASALRRMLDCCRRVGLLTYEEYRNATSFTAKNAGKIHSSPAGVYLSTADIGTIVGTTLDGKGCPNTRVRDAALLLTLASCGARGWEVTGVRLQDVHLNESRIWLTRTKGGEPRNAWLHPLGVAAISRWIEIRGSQPGPLFVPLSRTGRPLHDHGAISTQQIRKVVHGRAAQAGYGGVATHDLRRFLVSSLLETHDLALVAKVVGHKNPATTAGYDRRPLQHQREAVASLNLPRLNALRHRDDPQASSEGPA